MKHQPCLIFTQAPPSAGAQRKINLYTKEQHTKKNEVIH